MYDSVYMYGMCSVFKHAPPTAPPIAPPPFYTSTRTVDVLNVLNLNMENKARSYESPFLAAIFLINNFHFIHKTFTKNSQMLSLLEGVFGEVQSHYEGVIQQQIHAYQRTYVEWMCSIVCKISSVKMYIACM